MADRPNLGDFVLSPVQMRNESRRKVKSQDIWDALRGEDGDDGKDGVSITSARIENGELVLSFSDESEKNVGIVRGEKGDLPTKEKLLALIKPLIPTVEDGYTPSDEELITIILPLIPEPIKGQDGSPDSPDEVVEKVNKAKKKIKQEAIEGLDKEFQKHRETVSKDFSKATRALSGGNTNIRIKQNGTAKGQVETLNFTNLTVTPVGDGREANVTANGTGSSPLTTKGDVYTYSTADDRLGVGADGMVLTADSAQATGLKWATPASGSFAVLVPTGSVNGVNKAFVFASAPSVIVLDNGTTMNKVNSDTTVNWTGTTNVSLTVAPNFNIFGF